MRTIKPSISYSIVYRYSVVLGAGADAYVQASFPIVQTKVRPEQGSDVLALIGYT